MAVRIDLDHVVEAVLKCVGKTKSHGTAHSKVKGKARHDRPSIPCALSGGVRRAIIYHQALDAR